MSGVSLLCKAGSSIAAAMRSFLSAPRFCRWSHCSLLHSTSVQPTLLGLCWRSLQWGHHLPGFMRAYGERELFRPPQGYLPRLASSGNRLRGLECIQRPSGLLHLLGPMGPVAFLHAALRLHEDLRCQTPQTLASQFATRLVADGRLVRLYHHRQPPLLDQFSRALPRYGFGLYTWITPEFLVGLREWVFLSGHRNSRSLRGKHGRRAGGGHTSGLAEAGNFTHDFCHCLLRLYRP